MATGYTIKIGYMSGDATVPVDDYFGELVKTVQAIIDEPYRMAKEAREYGAPDYCCEQCQLERINSLIEFCGNYRQKDNPGCALSIIGDTPLMPGMDTHYVFISCSGGDPSRSMKEHVARAFCRLVMQDMHRKGIEVSINVN